MKKYIVCAAGAALVLLLGACPKKAADAPAEREAQTGATAVEEAPVQPATDNSQGDPTAVTTDQPIMDEGSMSGAAAPAQSTAAPTEPAPAGPAPAAN
jgi:hypothetical protein